MLFNMEYLTPVFVRARARVFVCKLLQNNEQKVRISTFFKELKIH